MQEDVACPRKSAHPPPSPSKVFHPLLSPLAGTGNSKLLIEVAVPIGVVMAIVIAVLFVVLAYYCVRRKSAGDDSAYRPLSVHADEDDEEGTGDDSEP